MDLKTVEWKHNKIRLIDQTKLPNKLVYVDIATLPSLWQAIKVMKVRGAPALGATAALGIYLGLKDSKAKTFASFVKELTRVADYIGSSRPTARNLFWALERVKRVVFESKDKAIGVIKEMILWEAETIIQEDMDSCRAIGAYGASLFKSGDSILTICNTGILATIDYGTALGVINRAFDDGKKIKVFACETRPMLQGARLTAWELKRKGIDATLLCDSMAAALMRQGRVNKVIAGADRIAANGDTANKIGTYSLAVLSKYHKIPFYIAAPASTFDLKVKCGREIPIEDRKASEMTELFFKDPVAPSGIKVFNPAFDVTPSELITAIITDRGIVKAPYGKNIKKIIV